jgi:hypothetical protein
MGVGEVLLYLWWSPTHHGGLFGMFEMKMVVTTYGFLASFHGSKQWPVPM